MATYVLKLVRPGRLALYVTPTGRRYPYTAFLQSAATFATQKKAKEIARPDESVVNVVDELQPHGG